MDTCRIDNIWIHAPYRTYEHMQNRTCMDIFKIENTWTHGHMQNREYMDRLENIWTG